ncbi:MAG TPA: nickel pincer cofactor biosynthesis protein LarC [Candidatus Acidoferrales bacterium]|nr:nickel pincer cofactor biosynthesis protein LarC [Candidatus Acidoferrales bacterium]
MTIAYFDCFSGISGDMTLGALLDAGAPRSLLEAAVETLGLAGEVGLEVRRAERGHLGGTQVVVSVREGRARRLPELEAAVAGADLPAGVRERALEALRRLGEAEAALHGRPAAEVHLHELGGADTLVDLVGAFWLLDGLGVSQAYASPLPAPSGLGGDGLPHNAPAALRLLAGAGAVLEPDPRREELVTPTGAAFLAVAARFERPTLTLARVGYGIGTRDRPGNGLAVWLGEPAEPAGGVSVIETNLDDMAPNLLAALVEDLLAAGALDVSVTPLLMKKGRLGHLLSVLCEPERAPELARRVLESSTTLGVRVTRAARVLAGRRLLEVETPLGRARVKVKEVGGAAVDVAPEFEDVRRLAAASGQDLTRVQRLVAEAARRQLGLP